MYSLVDETRLFAVLKTLTLTAGASGTSVTSSPFELPINANDNNNIDNTILLFIVVYYNVSHYKCRVIEAGKFLDVRYFNPVGAHLSGLIGENPNGIPNNLMPYITQVASGKMEKLHIFGNDYDTNDGTGVRDYIHVVNLAKVHVKALKILEHAKPDKPRIYNLGIGHSYSVIEIVKTFERVNGVNIPYTLDARRPGDVAVCYSDPSKAMK